MAGHDRLPRGETGKRSWCIACVEPKNPGGIAERGVDLIGAAPPVLGFGDVEVPGSLVEASLSL